MSRWIESLWYPPEREAPLRQVALGPLLLASGSYRLAVAARGALYDRGILRAHRVQGARVISVGNLNVGGTGKTPAVIYLARRLARSGRKVAVLTRGYGRSSRASLCLNGQALLPPASEAGDEPLLIARSCPGVPVLVGADRVALAQRAREELGAEVLLLDDGMQHRRLARDLDIVVVDARAGFGNGHLLPRGPLREPMAALRRAGLIWLRVDSGRAVEELRGAPVVEVRHRVRELLDPAGSVKPPDALRGAPVLALAGLARPSGFLRTLEELGARVAESRLFPDHYPFSSAELAAVCSRSSSAGLPIVTTEKDWVRLPPGFPAWVVRLEVEIVRGGELLAAQLGLLER
jgi:tetraacyldisaccharide 4'-kinase